LKIKQRELSERRRGERQKKKKEGEREEKARSGASKQPPILARV
jgi:hypothetical protein